MNVKRQHEPNQATAFQQLGAADQLMRDDTTDSPVSNGLATSMAKTLQFLSLPPKWMAQPARRWWMLTASLLALQFFCGGKVERPQSTAINFFNSQLDQN